MDIFSKRNDSINRNGAWNSFCKIGLKSVEFANAIGDDSDDFSLSISCRDDNGTVDYVVENITKDGFDITASADCKLSYIAIKH